MRTRITAALVAAAVAATSIAVSASFGPPVTSTSTLTLPSRDSVGVVVVYTSRCTTATEVARQIKGDSLACPNSWDIVSLVGADTVKVTRFRTTLRDTVRLAKPVCPEKPVFTANVLPRTQGIAINKPGVSRIYLPCRPETAAELAFADSFPKSGWTYRLMTRWSQKAPKAWRDSAMASNLRTMLTAADSAAEVARWAAVDAGADSILLPVPPKTMPYEIQAVLGYQFSVCWYARNKYTGAIVELSPDTLDTRCDSGRLELENTKSASNTGVVPEQFWKPPNPT